MRKIIYRVLLGGPDAGFSLTLADYQRFVREAKQFGIPPDTHVTPEPVRYGLGQPNFYTSHLMVERVIDMEDS